jgi:hypothetical protein
LGSFLRDGRRILVLVNVGKTAYQGTIRVAPRGEWQILEPANGRIRPAQKTDADHVKLALAPRQAILLVQ